MTDDIAELLASATTEETSEPAGVRELAENLMELLGLPLSGPDRWTLVFDQAKTRAGQCRRSTREISLSAPLMSVWTPAQVRDTVLHEIAHALTKGGHGYQWQEMCRKIGADPTRTWGHDGEQEIPGKYTGTCPAGHVVVRHRKPRQPRSCGQCGPWFDIRNLITWTENET
jgi:predicted SprT family Zn-dependent metalloprotease